MSNKQSRNKKAERNQKPTLRVLGMLEKRWGQLTCAHGGEGVTSLVRLPDFPRE